MSAARLHDAEALPLWPPPRLCAPLSGSVDVPASLDLRAFTHAAITAPQTCAALLPGVLTTRITGAACDAQPRTLQGYTLRIDPSAASPISLAAPTPAGLRHGCVTLAQLLRVFDAALPAFMIEDEPAFEVRGFMLDVSRDRVPRTSELLWLLDTLALAKCNHLQLYIEHTFAYDGHEAAWRGTSPITPDDMRTLREACAARGIALAGNQNCFGHLSHWLKLPEYAHLAEAQGDWMFDVWPRSGPFSLCPTDSRSLDFVRDLLTQQSRELAPGCVFNIGCDETYDIAFGRSKPEVDRRGRHAVYAEFVEQVARSVRELGHRPAFWGDVLLHDSDSPQAREILSRFAELGMIGLAWGYEPDADFANWCSRLHGAGLEAWVCPGTSCWRTITGRTSERRANIARAAREGRAHNARGFLLTAWGDVGHMQQWPITLHALWDGLGHAWNPDDAEGEKARARAATLWGGAYAALGPWMDALGDADEPLRRVAGVLSRPDRRELRNATALFASLHAPVQTLRGLRHAELWREALQRLDALAATLPACPSALIEDELRQTLLFARFAARRALAVLRGSADARALRDELEHVRREHARLWLARSRSGGLESSMAKLAGVSLDW